jgi:anti-sigma factor RsiW
MGNAERRRMTCAEAMDRIHRILDGDLMDAMLRQELEDHIAACADCRMAQDELGAIHSALGALPELELPDSALEEVARRTSRPLRSARTRPRRAPWWAAAAAAVLAVALYVTWDPGDPASYTDEEVARAAEQMRGVLGLTARTLHEAKQAAFDEVLAGEVSPALQRAPIRWPGAAGLEPRESGDDV